MQQKLYLYHMTDAKNLESISQHGLIPKIHKIFSPLTPEANDRKPKIFFLPNLTSIGKKSFIDEWWHGSVEDIRLLRVPLYSVKGLMKSNTHYYAKQEVWTHYPVHQDYIYLNVGGFNGPYKWDKMAKNFTRT